MSRSDEEKAAEQARIALDYQRSVNARRRKSDGVVATPTEVVDFQIRSVLEQVAGIGREPDLEETGARGAVRVICTDTLALPPDSDLWSDDLPLVRPSEVSR